MVFLRLSWRQSNWSLFLKWRMVIGPNRSRHSTLQHAKLIKLGLINFSHLTNYVIVLFLEIYSQREMPRLLVLLPLFSLLLVQIWSLILLNNIFGLCTKLCVICTFGGIFHVCIKEVICFTNWTHFLSFLHLLTYNVLLIIGYFVKKTRNVFSL